MKLKANAYIIAMVFNTCYILAYLFLLILLTRTGVKAIHETYRETVIAMMALAVLLFYAVFAASRFPYITKLDGEQIITYGLRGKRAINLKQLEKVSFSTWFLVKYAASTPGFIKLSDKDGSSIFLQLGMVPRSKRLIIRKELDQAISPYLTEGSNVILMWKSWFSFMEKTKNND